MLQQHLTWPIPWTTALCEQRSGNLETFCFLANKILTISARRLGHEMEFMSLLHCMLLTEFNHLVPFKLLPEFIAI